MITLIESKTCDAPITVEEAQALILGQELCIVKYHKQNVTNLASVNLAHAVPSESPVNPSSTTSNAVSSMPSDLQVHLSENQNPNVPFSDNRVGFTFGYGFGRGCGGRFGRGCGGRGFVQCQLCLKFGHSAVKCYHRSISINPPMLLVHLDWFLFGLPYTYPPSSAIPPLLLASQAHVSSPTTAPQAMLAGSSVHHPQWIPDSGAFFHVASNGQHIQQT